MAYYRLYFILERLNLSDDNWVELLQAVREQVVKRGNDPSEKLSFRASANTFNYGTVEDPIIYSNEYIALANFEEAIVDPDTIKNFLVGVFEVDPSLVTYNTTQTQVAGGERLTGLATYAYNASNRLRIAFLGCPTQNNLATYEQGGIEARALIASDPVTWGEDVQ